MTATFTGRVHRAIGAALAAVLVAVLTGCATSEGTRDGDTAASSATLGRSSRHVVLRFGDQAVGATLADTPAAREFAEMLPLSLELSETWGQAKSGRLPRPVSVEGAPRSSRPAPGGIYYWPDTATLAVYYDDLGQTVPPPGLVLLGVLDTGVDEIADLGKVTVRIDQSTQTGS
jgi:hypothetical protein